MLLLQLSPQYLDAFKAYRKQSRGYVIATWDNVQIPVEISADSVSGWKQLEIRHRNGEVKQWPAPLPVDLK